MYSSQNITHKETYKAKGKAALISQTPLEKKKFKFLKEKLNPKHT